MELPHRYPFNPPWQPILLLSAVGAGLLALLGSLHWAPARLGAALGAILLAFAFVLAARRFALPWFLELEEDTFLLPAGFLRARTTKIVYADIEWMREIQRRDAIFELRAKGRTHNILSSFLPDAASYVDIRDFLTSRHGQEQQKHPCPPESAECSRYCFQCSSRATESFTIVLARSSGVTRRNIRVATRRHVRYSAYVWTVSVGRFCCL